MSNEAEVVETKLLPCWCRTGACSLGVEPHMDHGDFGCRVRGYYVHCSNCWASGPASGDEQEAREGWNKSRVSTSADYIRGLEDAAKIAHNHSYLSQHGTHWLTTASFQIEDKIRALIPNNEAGEGK